jgi:hypothetical protein
MWAETTVTLPTQPDVGMVYVDQMMKRRDLVAIVLTLAVLALVAALWFALLAWTYTEGERQAAPKFTTSSSAVWTPSGRQGRRPRKPTRWTGPHRTGPMRRVCPTWTPSPTPRNPGRLAAHGGRNWGELVGREMWEMVAEEGFEPPTHGL